MANPPGNPPRCRGPRFPGAFLCPILPNRSVESPDDNLLKLVPLAPINGPVDVHYVRRPTRAG